MEGQLSADKEFVEERRVQLQKYLNALAGHPVRIDPSRVCVNQMDPLLFAALCGFKFIAA